MLEITGDSRTFCDGVSRRNFIRVGALGFLGLNLSDLFRLREAHAQTSRRKKSVILVWMHGGPTQLETYDPKPEAPSEYRGPYGAIETNVPGIRISDKLPLQARVMDKCTVIRSFTHQDGDHF